MQYDEMEYDDESEPEIPIYNRAELIERYQVIYCCAQTFLTCLLSWFIQELRYPKFQVHIKMVKYTFKWGGVICSFYTLPNVIYVRDDISFISNFCLLLYFCSKRWRKDLLCNH